MPRPSVQKKEGGCSQAEDGDPTVYLAGMWVHSVRLQGLRFPEKVQLCHCGGLPTGREEEGGSAAVPWRQKLQALPEALENQRGILVAGRSTATVAWLPLKATATQGSAQARRRQTEAPPSGVQGSSPASEAGGRSLSFYADVNLACLIWYY